MQGRKYWLCLAVVFVALVGSAVAIQHAATAAVVVEPKGDHWRNFDGHWSYWHDGDHRWYYTDGRHWYYHNGLGWVVYEFDKLFGRTGFHHGDYKVPVDRAKIEVSKHGVYEHK